MKDKTIYLCGPIHGRSDAECNNWRNVVTHSWGGPVLNPMVKDARLWLNEPGIAKQIVEADKRDILACNALLVYYAVPTVGTSMEILFAWEQRKPIVLINASMQPVNELSLWLRYHATDICADIRSAIIALEDRLHSEGQDTWLGGI